MRKKMWHCKSCGRVCDSSNTVCPDCGLDLGFYGEIQFVETGEPEPSPSPVSQLQEQAKPVAEEESRPEMKREHTPKERKPQKEGKHGKALFLTVVVLLALLVPDRIIATLWNRGIRNRSIWSYFNSSFSNLLELAIPICLVVALLIVMIKAVKRSKTEKAGKHSIILISTVVILQALLILENNLFWSCSWTIGYVKPIKWFMTYSVSPFRSLLLFAVHIYLVVALLILMVQEAKRSKPEKGNKWGMVLIVPVVVLYALSGLNVIMLVSLNSGRSNWYPAYIQSPFYSLLWTAARICLVIALVILIAQAVKRNKSENESKRDMVFILIVVTLQALLLAL